MALEYFPSSIRPRPLPWSLPAPADLIPAALLLSPFMGTCVVRVGELGEPLGESSTRCIIVCVEVSASRWAEL